MIIVADTSPLNYLILVGTIDVLPELFGEVHAPPEVLMELQHPRTPEIVKRWAETPPEWLRIKQPSRSSAITAELDPGEAQAIDLALELGAEAVLIDERRGRSVAKSHGLPTLSTITVLELADEHELLDLRAVFEILQKTTFHITQELLDAALERKARRKAQR